MTWTTMVVNDPHRDMNLYIELFDDQENAHGGIARGSDGELYFYLFATPEVHIPYKWLVSLESEADTLPRVSDDP